MGDETRVEGRRDGTPLQGVDDLGLIEGHPIYI